MTESIKNSQSRILKSLERGFMYHHLAVARSDKFLRKHDSERLPMFVLYVDLVGSTKMSSELDPEIFTTIIRIFSQEMSYVIEQYGGYVLKFVGDAVLGYFSFHKENSSNQVIECAKQMRKIMNEAINPILAKKSFPELKIKISIDFGDCSVIRYGSDKKRSHIDLIGLTLNLAAKMQQITKPSQITIGEFVYEKLNSQNKRLFQKAKTDPKSWKYHELKKSKPYFVYVKKNNSKHSQKPAKIL